MTVAEAFIRRRDDARQVPMRFDRGVAHHLVGPDDGASLVDAHVNVLNQDSGMGPYHLHERAENVYVVLDGIFRVIVDGRRYYLAEGDVAFIPPGTPHAAGSAGFGTATAIEIYAPAGPDFHILDDPTDVEDVDRPEIAHLLPGGDDA
ncbi:MAG: cupin domain-containing protein [Streptosporangiales bacterium]|nr:cupin domain-containing protein [Streptosporangiales bacterium]